MASFGYNPSRNNWFFSDGALDNQAWDTAISVGAVGRIQDINAYFGGDTGGCTGGPVLWDGSGNLINSTGLYTAHSVSQGSRGVNGGFTVTTSGLDWTFSNPTSFIVGGFRNSGDSWVTPMADNVGNYGTLKLVSGSSPGAATGGSPYTTEAAANGGITAYADYFSGTFWGRRSGAWVQAVDWGRRSGAWNAGGARPAIKGRRSSAWTLVNELADRQELDWKVEQPAICIWPDGSWDYGIFRWDYDRLHRFGRDPMHLRGRSDTLEARSLRHQDHRRITWSRRPASGLAVHKADRLGRVGSRYAGHVVR
jgi:hypothetical protein